MTFSAYNEKAKIEARFLSVMQYISSEKLCIKGSTAETVIVFPNACGWDMAEYAMYCHGLWRAIIAFWLQKAVVHHSLFIFFFAKI